jgi:hypothetical protein
MRRTSGTTAVCILLSLCGLLMNTGVSSSDTTSRRLGSNGGIVTFSYVVNGATSCSWSSRPIILGFARRTHCVSGRTSRQANIKPNKSTSARSYVITLDIRGRANATHHWTVVEAGQPAAPKRTMSNVSVALVNMGALVQVHGNFENVSSVTVTTNWGDTCTSNALTSDTPTYGSTPYFQCRFSYGSTFGEEYLTSLTVSSLGLPSQTFGWTRLSPTVTVADDGSGRTRVTVTSGTFVGNPFSRFWLGTELTGGGVVVFVERWATGYNNCTDSFPASAEPAIATCVIDEPISIAELSTFTLDWTPSIYIIASNQGTPVEVPMAPFGQAAFEVTVTYHSSTGTWY